jgi:hypothetical protein
MPVEVDPMAVRVYSDWLRDQGLQGHADAVDSLVGNVRPVILQHKRISSSITDPHTSIYHARSNPEQPDAAWFALYLPHPRGTLLLQTHGRPLGASHVLDVTRNLRAEGAEPMRVGADNPLTARFFHDDLAKPPAPPPPESAH